MSTLLFIIACGVLGLVIVSKIPGLEYLVKPIIDLVFSAVKVIAANSSYWLVWLIKLLIASHSDLLRHLALPAEAIDPSQSIRDQEA